MAGYDFTAIEQRWRRVWDELGLFAPPADAGQERRYLLDMFAYPSGDLHMGHAEAYALGDAVARYWIQRGYHVLHPVGWDSFGLPAENAAIKRGEAPATWTYANIDTQAESFRRYAVSVDWRTRLHTSDPSYYRWTQWLFLRFFEAGLAYRKRSAVNWCPVDQTVLANEQVIAGRCERCGSQVTKRELTQWFFRITAYADRLLDDMAKLAGRWPEPILTMQRNWIGRSPGAFLDFAVEGHPPLTVFTTRPDTVFGATFLVVAPDSARATELCAPQRRPELEAYLTEVRQESEIDRMSPARPKTGVFLGRHAKHPFTGDPIPIWASDYVLSTHGTGAIMAVPAHDQRDLDFAHTFDLPTPGVAPQTEAPPHGQQNKKPQAKAPPSKEPRPDGQQNEKPQAEAPPSKEPRPDGQQIEGPQVERPPSEGPRSEATSAKGPQAERPRADLGMLDGLGREAAIERVVAEAEVRGVGRAGVTYRLRDWLLSRQRFWGCPIPIVHCPRCGEVPVPDDELPVLLPDLHGAALAPRGVSPLAAARDWVEVACPACGGPAERDTDTMDTFVDSSWYYLRYCSPQYTDGPFDPAEVRKWMPADQYIGGSEHATLHLLYARFFTKVLHDLGLVDFDEPFRALLNQGQIILDGAAMSKSKGNMVDLAEQLDAYGVDAVRLTMVFAGPPEDDIDWADVSPSGSVRFLSRALHLAGEVASAPGSDPATGDETLRRTTHRLLRAITDRIEDQRFNVAVARTMELVNAARKSADQNGGADPAVREAVETVAVVLSLFTPYAAEEMWSLLGHEPSVAHAGWPAIDPALAAEPTVVCAIQVNGKLRDRLQVPTDITEADLTALALASPAVAGKTVTRTVVRPPRLVNLLVTNP